LPEALLNIRSVPGPCVSAETSRMVVSGLIDVAGSVARPGIGSCVSAETSLAMVGAAPAQIDIAGGVAWAGIGCGVSAERK